MSDTPFNAAELLDVYQPLGPDPLKRYGFTVANFETTVCSRCGGGGEYSWNAMTGSRCFGCNGSGFKMTKRGRAALDFYRDSQRQPVTELAPETMVIDDHGKRCYFVGVVENTTWRINRETGERYQLDGEISYQLRYANDAKWTITAQAPALRVLPTPEQREQQRLAALAYQDSLTKTGQPRKTKASS